MDEFSRPTTPDDLKALIRALNEHQVDYLLIGGFALFAHGHTGRRPRNAHVRH